MKKPASGKQKIHGIVTPAKWNEKGAVTGIAIQATNEEEYIVDLCKKGKELFKYINDKIEIEGKVKERVDGKKVITINKYYTEKCGENRKVLV